MGYSFPKPFLSDRLVAAVFDEFQQGHIDPVTIDQGDMMKTKAMRLISQSD